MDILLVEDDSIIQRMLIRMMERRGHTVTAFADGEQALAKLKTQWFSLIFLDLNLPGMSGLDLSRTLRKLKKGDEYYIIVGTGETGLDTLDTILDAGADDYVAKPYRPSLLEVRMAVAEKRIQEIEERAKLQKELLFLAKHDPLTRLLNRWQLNDAIKSSVDSMANGEKSGCLLALDLDHFKEVNDTCGHQAGDRLLVQVAETLTQHLPPDAWIIRYGGDEFIAVMPTTPTPEAVDMTEALAEAITSIDLPEIPDLIRPSASMGLTSVRPNTEPKDLLKEADMACYRAKSFGRNRAEVFVRFDEQLLRPRRRVAKGAIPSGRIEQGEQLQLWFQPICNLQNGQIFFQEALLRFLSARGSEAIQAAMFMSQMSDRAYIRSLDRFVIHEICQRLEEHPNLRASININALSMNDWDFARSLLSLLDEFRIAPERLVIEITETSAIQDVHLARAVMGMLHEAGIVFALDDFGAGFSSITALKTLPVGLVKVDGSLIRNLPKESFNQVFINALEVFSLGVGFGTIAERIETREEMDFAREHGVHYGQGFLLGRPRLVPYEDQEMRGDLFPGRAALPQG